LRVATYPPGQPHPDGVDAAADAERGRHPRSLLHRPPLDRREPLGQPSPGQDQHPGRRGGGHQGRPDPPLRRVAALEERPDVEQGASHRAHPEQLTAGAESGLPERGILVLGQPL
jgi:hypothetical protein